MEECMARFQNQFFDPSIAGDCRPVEATKSKTKGDLLNLFTVKKIKEFIERYPVQKACGEDSIHILLLQKLVDSSFVNLLSELFIQCIQQETTPSRWNERSEERRVGKECRSRW